MRVALLAVVLLTGMSCTCGTKVPDRTIEAPMTDRASWLLVFVALFVLTYEGEGDAQQQRQGSHDHGTTQKVR